MTPAIPDAMPWFMEQVIGLILGFGGAFVVVKMLQFADDRGWLDCEDPWDF